MVSFDWASLWKIPQWAWMNTRLHKVRIVFLLSDAQKIDWWVTQFSCVLIFRWLPYCLPQWVYLVKNPPIMYDATNTWFLFLSLRKSILAMKQYLLLSCFQFSFPWWLIVSNFFLYQNRKINTKISQKLWTLNDFKQEEESQGSHRTNGNKKQCGTWRRTDIHPDMYRTGQHLKWTNAFMNNQVSIRWQEHMIMIELFQ